MKPHPLEDFDAQNFHFRLKHIEDDIDNYIFKSMLACTFLKSWNTVLIVLLLLAI